MYSGTVQGFLGAEDCLIVGIPVVLKFLPPALLRP